MSIRALIAALVLWATLALAVLGVITSYALWQSGYLAQRVARVHERLVTLAAIDGAANQYGENVAMVLLLNRNGLDFLGTSRVAMERNFARLSQVTRDEIGSLAGVGDVQGELPELDNTRRMTELYHAIDRSTARMLIELREGQQAEARELFDREIAFRLSNELQPLIDSELDGERREVEELAADAAGAQQRLVVAAGITGGVAFVGFALIGLFAWRAIHAAEAAVARAAASREEAAREAERRLGALEMRRAQFLADISHELRTPVTILRGEAEVGLRGAPGPEELRDTLERVQGQTTELGELLEDLITYARADSEEQEFSPTTLPVSEVVAAAASEGASLAEPREVTVTTELDDDPLVEADPRRLKRVLLIGIDNAVKHSAPGSMVTVRARREAANAVIEVLDEGPGIAEEEKPKVFERFFRGRGERELQNRGIGIGLAIAREILELHRGRISLDNRAEGGAVLTITLPAKEA